MGNPNQCYCHPALHDLGVHDPVSRNRAMPEHMESARKVVKGAIVGLFVTAGVIVASVADEMLRHHQTKTLAKMHLHTERWHQW